MFRNVCVGLLIGAAFLAQPVEAKSPQSHEMKSYTARWSTEIRFEDRIQEAQHRATMFPHEIEGCKVLLQSIRREDYFFEEEGLDCNCDNLIDGRERVFGQADGYYADKLNGVCTGPGVDGKEDKLIIMRESLKEMRDFSYMKNVKPF